MLDLAFITALKKQLSRPLPGQAAQAKMATGTRKEFPIVPKKAKEACVLCLLYPKENKWHIALMRRVSSSNPKDTHSGQMSFPGGKKEATDENYEQAALRETEEEMGIPREAIDILGKLTPLYIPVSNFIVYPFVGVLPTIPNFIPEAAEVKQIVELPLALLLDKKSRQVKDITIRDYTIKDVPYFNVFGNVVWGATAMMLSEFVEVVRRVEEVVVTK